MNKFLQVPFSYFFTTFYYFFLTPRTTHIFKAYSSNQVRIWFSLQSQDIESCAILGLALFGALRAYSFIENIVFGIGAGLGFTLALVIMAGIREELDLADVPEPLKGAAITLIIAGLLALAFMGFAGLISV